MTVSGMIYSRRRYPKTTQTVLACRTALPSAVKPPRQLRVRGVSERCEIMTFPSHCAMHPSSASA